MNEHIGKKQQQREVRNGINVAFQKMQNALAQKEALLTKNTEILAKKEAELEVCKKTLSERDAEILALKTEMTNALSKIAQNQSPDYGAIARDEQFIDEYALFSDALKKRVIEQYLKELNATMSAPVLKSGVGSTPLTPPKKPKSLAEAKKLAEILIKG
jgi:recombinational DNA repair ATPase RecF